MTKEEITHIYFKKMWLSPSGYPRFPRSAMYAYRAGVIREEEKEMYGIDKLITRVRDKDCVKNRVKRAKIVRFTLC